MRGEYKKSFSCLFESHLEILQRVGSNATQESPVPSSQGSREVILDLKHFEPLFMGMCFGRETDLSEAHSVHNGR